MKAPVLVLLAMVPAVASAQEPHASRPDALGAAITDGCGSGEPSGDACRIRWRESRCPGPRGTPGPSP
jgi:hypothetical protein